MRWCGPCFCYYWTARHYNVTAHTNVSVRKIQIERSSGPPDRFEKLGELGALRQLRVPRVPHISCSLAHLLLPCSELDNGNGRLQSKALEARVPCCATPCCATSNPEPRLCSKTIHDRSLGRRRAFDLSWLAGGQNLGLFSRWTFHRRPAHHALRRIAGTRLCGAIIDSTHVAARRPAGGGASSRSGSALVRQLVVGGGRRSDECREPLKTGVRRAARCRH